MRKPIQSGWEVDLHDGLKLSVIAAVLEGSVVVVTAEHVGLVVWQTGTVKAKMIPALVVSVGFTHPEMSRESCRKKNLQFDITSIMGFWSYLLIHTHFLKYLGFQSIIVKLVLHHDLIHWSCLFHVCYPGLTLLCFGYVFFSVFALSSLYADLLICAHCTLRIWNLACLNCFK